MKRFVPSALEPWFQSQEDRPLVEGGLARRVAVCIVALFRGDLASLLLVHLS